jgi:hypothetical protein
MLDINASVKLLKIEIDIHYEIVAFEETTP